jgi:carbamoyl-phosphate synthase large subunit
MVTKRIGKGRPDMLDVILNGTVDGVINTPGPAEKEVLDGFQIRRAAVEKGIPCITSVDTAEAVVRAMRSSGAYTIMPLPAYRQRVSVGY